MAFEVDPVREAVRGERQIWPFALDCRADSAAISLGGKVYRLQPLRWREKRNLSRFHRLGEEFIARQLVKLCLVDDVPLPVEPDEYEALLALARWINAPGDDGSSLPLDPGLLASVTLAASRSAGVPSTDLDLEKADIVERLWLERNAGPVARPGEVAPNRPAPLLNERPAATPPLPDPGEMNRILILPDPPSAADPAYAQSADTLPASDQPVPPTSATADFPAAPAPTAEPSAPQIPALRPPDRFRVRLPASVDAPRRPAGTRSEPVGGRVSDRPAIVAGLPTVAGLSESVATTADAKPDANGGPNAEARSSAVERPDSQSVSDGTSLWSVAASHAPIERGLPRAPGLTRVESDSIRLPWPVRPASQHWEDPTHGPTAAGVRADALDDPEADDLFDQWVTRLEQAAEQLGIDPEG